MAISEKNHHRINYIEFAVNDLSKAKTFYSSAFGWEFNDYGPSYSGIKDEAGEVGGLALGSLPTAGGPLVILFSKDLETSLTSVRNAGGKITKEPFAFPGGRRFHFLDPSGNELAVWAET
jgi:predicted enzyme related to lactoylglutathione lyase